ncbi:hypothetical protein BD309DRAFT_945409 [Dichomitus squalens]|uniref:Uncharacterized protein n=1 Tax=Dichomitus squalens TaxID=114155 RepID=A0A4V6MWX4_9APHY|nr:hypothetical protein BD309DRAFT_945409 [Dichomitus squalens]TBU62898.1 hypothetical protein BD310DRAFT_917368 [Dichomitus squalens]
MTVDWKSEGKTATARKRGPYAGADAVGAVKDTSLGGSTASRYQPSERASYVSARQVLLVPTFTHPCTRVRAQRLCELAASLWSRGSFTSW